MRAEIVHLSCRNDELTIALERQRKRSDHFEKQCKKWSRLVLALIDQPHRRIGQATADQAGATGQGGELRDDEKDARGQGSEEGT